MPIERQTRFKHAPGGRVAALSCRLWYDVVMVVIISKKKEEKLAELVREFFAAHPGIKIIAVTGSAGKASAKIAIGTVLAQQFNIRLNEEEPRTKADVLLQLMGINMPEKGIFRWLRLRRKIKKYIKTENSAVQLIVQEFNPQEPGYNEWFRSYIIPDITIVTSVTNGRMQVEHSLEEVANEMISLANFSRMAMINRDDIDGSFAGFLTNPNITTYGSDPVAEYNFDDRNFSLEDGHHGFIMSPENTEGLEVDIKLIGEHNIRPAIVAAAVGYATGESEDNIKKGVESLRPLPGRMNLLRGADNTWLLDDSYSSTPLTALAALQSLYKMETPQRIAVLGNMNGLRGIFEQAHADLGSHCSTELLDWVVTVGEKANMYLAPAARQKGCQVKECRNAIEAGAFVRDKLKSEGIALFKGSSGGVWLEEAIKINLHSTEDEKKLVRQTPQWIARKNQFFSQFKG